MTATLAPWHDCCTCTEAERGRVRSVDGFAAGSTVDDARHAPAQPRAIAAEGLCSADIAQLWVVLVLLIRLARVSPLQHAFAHCMHALASTQQRGIAQVPTAAKQLLGSSVCAEEGTWLMYALQLGSAHLISALPPRTGHVPIVRLISAPRCPWLYIVCAMSWRWPAAPPR